MSTRSVSVVLSSTSPKESAANDRSSQTDIRAVTDRRVVHQANDQATKIAPLLLAG